MLDACKKFLSGTLQLAAQCQLPKEGWLHILQFVPQFSFPLQSYIFVAVFGAQQYCAPECELLCWVGEILNFFGGLRY
jgi:hypothetical protein